MMTIITAAGQTFLDIALILTGSADAAYEIAKENGFDISDKIPAGRLLLYTDKVISQPIAEYYSAGNIHPATSGEDDNADIDKIFDFTFDSTFE
jgi:hypothetical protein